MVSGGHQRRLRGREHVLIAFTSALIGCETEQLPAASVHQHEIERFRVIDKHHIGNVFDDRIQESLGMAQAFFTVLALGDVDIRTDRAQSAAF